MFRLKINLFGAEISNAVLEEGRTYVAGRSPGCDIQLGDHQGISRQHFRLFLENGQWIVQVMSKFGEVWLNETPKTEILLEPGTVFRVPPYDFTLLYDAAQAEDSSDSITLNKEIDPNLAAVGVTRKPLATNNALTPYTAGSSALQPQEDPFAGSDDITTVGNFEGLPYVRIERGPGEPEETLRLEGNLWIAGRDESCEITLDDHKASRRQFELAATDEGYFITDLGSANGTMLNGSELPANEAVAIRSGDVISISTLQIHFEIRDPNFKNKLVVIPPNILSAPPMIMTQSPGEMMPYQGYHAGGMAPVDQNGYPTSDWAPVPQSRGLDFSQPKTKIMAATTALIVIIAIVFSGGEKESGNKGDKQAASGDPRVIALSRLSEPQRKLVEHSYRLAKNFFMQQKWELASSELRKIHDILPEGFEDSLKIREDIDQLRIIQREKDNLEKDRRQVEENQRRVREIISKCQSVANRTTSVDEIQACVADGLMIEPENSSLSGMVSQVQRRVERNQQDRIRSNEYAGAVARRKSVFSKAQKTDQSGDKLGAIAAYESFIKSSGPDPENLETKAKTRITTLQSEISTDVEKYLDAAQQFFEQKKGKEAYAELEKALAVDPINNKITNMMEVVVKELDNQLQGIYADSVLEEGVGNIDAAKEKWRKIIETDRPGGEYYRRAKSKMKIYGNQ